MESPAQKRVDVLDGLRVIAILMVMIYHFYSRFAVTHYSYSFVAPDVFKYGYLGVQLFFIISGFVITLTLAKCENFVVFIKKRFIRLIPGMVICSLLTFLFINAVDNENLFGESKNFSNLVVSNTFISPVLINEVAGTNLNYTDGAYWSLWVEIQFYILAGLLFFYAPAKFLRNFTILAFAAIIGMFVISSGSFAVHLSKVIGLQGVEIMRSFVRIFSFCEYSLWFLLGILVHKLFFGTKDIRILLQFLAVFLIQMVLLKNAYAIIFSVLVLITFLIFIYKQHWLGFLANNLFKKLGVASYSVYLIHQNIGVLSINKLSAFFGSFNWLLPVLLIIVLCLFGIVSYKYFENPFGKWLHSILLKKKLQTR